MKTRKLLAAVSLGALVLGTAHAQSTTNTSTSSAPKSFYQKLKDSPLSLRLAESFGSIGTTDKITGGDATSRVTLGYQLTDKDSLSLENRWVTTKNPSQESDTVFDRIHFRYSRSILAESDYGFGLAGGLERRFRPNAQYRSAANRRGLTRLSVTASKNITSNLSVVAIPHVAFYDVREKVGNYDKNYMYLVLGQSYTLPANFTLSAIEEFFHVNNEEDKGQYNEVLGTIELAKRFTPEFSMDFSVGATLVSNADDSWKTNNTWDENLSYSLGLNLTAF